MRKCHNISSNTHSWKLGFLVDMVTLLTNMWRRKASSYPCMWQPCPPGWRFWMSARHWSWSTRIEWNGVQYLQHWTMFSRYVYYFYSLFRNLIGWSSRLKKNTFFMGTLWICILYTLLRNRSVLETWEGFVWKRE